MPECPRCHQSVEAQAIVCPYCRMELKAYGHPGIPLYRASGEEPLCLTCAYDADDTCTFPKRPHAMDCTLYRRQQSSPMASPRYTRSFLVKTWFKRNQVWFLLAVLLLISLIVTLLR